MSKQLVWACNWVIPDCCILMTHISWIIKVIRSAQLSIEKLGSPSESLQRCTNHPWNIFARNFTYNVMELLFSPNHGFHHATITFISFDKKSSVIFDQKSNLWFRNSWFEWNCPELYINKLVVDILELEKNLQWCHVCSCIYAVISKLYSIIYTV